MTNKQALREAANAANIASWGRWESYHPHKGARGYEVKVGVKAIAQHCLKVDSVFIAAANPATVLALLDELEVISKSEWKLAGDLTEAQMNNTILEKKLEAAEKRISELEKKEHHIERQSVIDALATAGESWSDIEEYMQHWDAEHAASRINGEG